MICLTSLRYGKGQGRWKYILTAPMRYVAPEGWPTARYHALTGEPLIEVRAGIVTIHKGYAWDGMTCAPDWCLEASLIHDAGCQMRTCPVFRRLVPQASVDGVFRDVMREFDFVLWPVYWGAVRVYQSLRGIIVKHETEQLIEFAHGS